MAVINATKSKQNLKDTFGNVGTCIYTASDMKIAKQKSGKTTVTMPTDGIEFPVAVNTLNLNQSAPTINHYKVVGLSGDWFSTSESGDLEISFDVPTKHSDILKTLYGEDAVQEIEATIGSDKWEGSGLVLTEKAMTGTFILINQEENQMMILNNIKLWATPNYENSQTEPFKFTLTGTMEISDNEGDEINFAWLRKGAPTSVA